ncbi:MAG: glycosyltransferase family 2 protein, partial [Candidatus Omnitrophota bacterium]|nr:glycosyltransferase family 2 protein [Candidatus Omnitrophota bacterium]
MRKIDPNLIPDAPDEIRLFMVIRNESLRLPYLFKYYSQLGVDRFFFVDNDSSDGSASFLLSQGEHAHVFWTNDSYGKAKCGLNWLDALLHKYGVGHWCIVGDADEHFIYPHYEEVSLKGLSIFLDKK